MTEHCIVCLNHIDKYKIILGRREGDECKKKAITDICINVFNNSLDHFGRGLSLLPISPRRENGRAFHLKMEEMQLVPDEGGFISLKYIHPTRFTSLGAVIGVGLNP